MPNFIPQTPDASPQRGLALAAAVNAALRGDTFNTGRVICKAGSDAVTVQDARCRAGRLALLIPLDAQAAALNWHLAAMTRGSMTFCFSAAPPADAAFGWAIIGAGTTAGN